MKLFKIILKILGVILLIISLLGAYVYLTYQYQFKKAPAKDLAAYTGKNIAYPFIDGQFQIPIDQTVKGVIIDSLDRSNLTDLQTKRKVISLNGIWEIEEGDFDETPTAFKHTCPIPGFADMATPTFEKVGEVGLYLSLATLKPSNLMGLMRFEDKEREAFWYRRTFTIDSDIPEVAMLKVKRAMYGSAIWINGQKVGGNGRNYTQGIYDIRELLKGNGVENEIIIRVATSIPYDQMKNNYGDVLEKQKHIPGIFDDVELSLSGAMQIEKVQVVPNIKEQSATVIAWLKNKGAETSTSDFSFFIKKYKDSTTVSGVKTPEINLKAGETKIIEVTIPIDNPQLWSPENPNLYTLISSSKNDVLNTRFGMRDFHFDKKTKVPLLNGQPYYMRGTSVPFYRFAEDPERKERPWDEAWVRKLFQKFKSMHWNQIRFHIGPAPDLWYRIADEEGMLIQDEYAIWTFHIFRTGLPLSTIVSEYVDWMEERWNYPSIVIWDAQNESAQTGEPRTGWALNMVRRLDHSNRPWDNGWGTPQADTDTEEQHPYLFTDGMSDFMGKKVGELFNMDELNKLPADTTNLGKDGHPVLVNEFAWLWVRRDGEPTGLTKGGYNKHFPDWTADQRFDYYARQTAAFTELYRSQRPAGVMQFAGLNNNYEGCKTSDIFLELENLTIEPHIENFLKDAYAPIGLCLYNWSDTIRANSHLAFPLTLVNDLATDWNGAIELTISDSENQVVWADSVMATVTGFGKAILPLAIDYPAKKDRYELVAKLQMADKGIVECHRQFLIID